MNGLSTEEALRKLFHTIEKSLSKTKPISKKELIIQSFSPRSTSALFPITSIGWSLVIFIALILSENPLFSILYFCLIIGNVILALIETMCKHNEMKRRVEYIHKKLGEDIPNINWNTHHYPHLHTPTSTSIVLQWTLRDGQQVNLPWALLVRDDVILVKPGQSVPGDCRSVSNPNLQLKQGDILHVKVEKSKIESPKPEFRFPVTPEKFILLETPYCRTLNSVLTNNIQVPSSLLLKYAHLFFVRLLSHILVPCILSIALVSKLISLYSERSNSFSFTQIVVILLPLVSLSFPLLWTLTTHGAMAKILCVFQSFRNINLGEEPSISFQSFYNFFCSSLFNTGEFLSRKENLVQTLGSITALCCTDKKGILSWPNTSAEKIFLLTTENSQKCENETTQSISTEILTITHDPLNPFNVEFDDPSWNRFIKYLKPIGLSILLNTCNIGTEEKYTNFYNHLICESFTKKNTIGTLPIVTRGCLCELAKKIGFKPSKIAKDYSLSNQIATFRHVQVSHHDKFLRNLSLAKLKFPFPHMVSVIVQERSTGSWQLFSQGTADLILDSSADFWSGTDLEPLREDVRKKILDFYQRASLSSYCTAFSYRPITFALPWNKGEDYLQLPTHSLPFYWQYSESKDSSESDAMYSHISLDNAYISNRNQSSSDAMLCLEMECNQTFLGMIQLQYQPCLEFIQLIDLLEQGCIRFVHFSKENELRSRVFSEKMGLESGWNCHISLKASDNTRNIVTMIDKYRRNKVSSHDNRFRLSLPVDLNRPPWFLDFPKWTEGSLLDDENGGNIDEVLGRQSSMNTNSETTSFEYDMSNRAQLPRGISNIRPHLETMDDVPLLVSLFTDCTSETSTEMVIIMQEYGEVICVLGSSASNNNTSIFLQSNASLSVEPRYPQICQSVPVYEVPKSGPSPIDISRMLNSVCTSLQFSMDDKVSIFHLILESRIFVLNFINTMQFWICNLILLACLQLLTILISSESFLSIFETMWITLFFVPLLSVSLIGTRNDPSEIMSISTGKNSIPLKFKYAAWCYGLRFFPSLILLISINQVMESMSWKLLFLELDIIVISFSFLSRSHQVWALRSYSNPYWIASTIFLLILRGIQVQSLENLNVKEWIIGIVGLLTVFILGEIVKRYEIKVNVRHQKRARLDFGTKLGINSPF